jgi:hypothetical protein
VWENTFELMRHNPSSVVGFYTWAANVLRVFSQAKAGNLPVPPSLSISMLLSGLASVPGATNTAGIFSSLRSTCKGEACADITDPRAFVDKVRQLFTAQEASAKAASSRSSRSQPTGVGARR